MRVQCVDREEFCIALKQSVIRLHPSVSNYAIKIEYPRVSRHGGKPWRISTVSNRNNADSTIEICVGVPLHTPVCS